MNLSKRVNDWELNQFWKEELKNGTKQWYLKSVAYWNEQPSTLEGVLGGFHYLSSYDIEGSRDFFKQMASMNELLKRIVHQERHSQGEMFSSIDCGCGIGRISANFLSEYFCKIDLLEPVEQLLIIAKKSLGAKVDKAYQCGLQDFHPVLDSYHMPWLQWVLTYLTDDDAVGALVKMKLSLKPGGVIISKENVASSTFMKDEEENSVTRTDAHYKDLFRKAGLKVILESDQPHWPKELFAVKMYALQP